MSHGQLVPKRIMKTHP